MTNQELRELLSCFDNSTAQSMRLSTQEFTIELTRGGSNSVPNPVIGGEVTAVSTPVSIPAPAGSAITAPLVGTFYAAPAPDQPPFVTEGQQVKEGETVCLIEAMKMMSEITAPCDCVIRKVLKADGELVAFGDPLVRYEPC